MKKLITFLLIFSPFFLSFASDIFPKKELHDLDENINSAHMYEKKLRNTLLAETKSILSNAPHASARVTWKRYNRLSSSYRLLDADSAIKYAGFSMHWAKSHNLVNEYQLSRLTFVQALATAGLFPSAMSEFDSIAKPSVNNPFKVEYYTTGRMLYSYLRAYVDGENSYFDKYSKLYRQFDDSLLHALPKGDKFAKFIIAERLIYDGKPSTARRSLLQLFNQLDIKDNIYGMTAYQLAQTYRLEGNDDEYARFLALAAISDIKRCVCEGMALPELAKLLYNHDHINEAFKYINFALNVSMQGNARMRTVSIATIVPDIDNAYRNNIEASRNKLTILVSSVAFVLILSLAFVYFLIRTIRRARKKEEQLRQIDKVRNSYIAGFIALCSNYAKRLDSLIKLVSRKISSGQSQELLKTVESGRFTDLHDDEFYKSIDSVVLDIFPDFINQINTLLKPEEQLSLKQDNSLSPDLRIYAFVRLGIDESTRIAQILNLSPNTVYAYRNRMRNKAVNRSSFDSDVQHLGTPDYNNWDSLKQFITKD